MASFAFATASTFGPDFLSLRLRRLSCLQHLKDSTFSCPRRSFTNLIHLFSSPEPFGTLRCRGGGPEADTGEPQTKKEPSPSPSPSPSPNLMSVWGISSSNLSAVLSALGFFETAYLSYLKLTNSTAFCPVGGECTEVLNSEYSIVFGFPLPILGMGAYGFVALLSLMQNESKSFPGLFDMDSRYILLATTSSMATASAYFLYLLSTEFSGTTCLYCLLSALLSFSLFFISVKDFGMENIQKEFGFVVAIFVIVSISLTNSYASITQLKSSDETTLELYESEIKTKSTAYTIALAKHLHSIGARMYGAFWCTHCQEQKEMFGREAAKILDYVECFPNGAGKGRAMAQECGVVGIQGFPTWVLKDKVLSGEQELPSLAEASGFVFSGGDLS